MESKIIQIENENNIRERIDAFLSITIPDLSRSYIKTLIDDDKVLVNGSKCKVSYKLQLGDTIEIQIPPPKELDIEPQDIKLDIIYEDRDVLVVNKSQGMVVHPAPGVYKDTLVNGLLYHISDLSDINGVMRPGIVHRIDKDTSGLLLVAKTNIAHKSLSKQLKDHSVNRRYLALVEGIITEDNGTIDAPIGRDPNNRKKMKVVERNSKEAVTHFKVLNRFNEYTLIEARLETGRTHQIRVHMSFINHPVVGDITYGHMKQPLYAKGQLLHAYTIGFIHPVSNDYLEFQIDLPRYFKDIIEKLNQ